MTDKEADKSAEARLQEMIRQQTNTVPEEISTRLASMRRAAVEELEAGAGTAVGLSRLQRILQSTSLLRPATGGLAFAGAALTVMLGVWMYLNAGNGTLEMPLVTEPEVALVQDLELLEDLEFLAWLEEESSGAG